MQVAPGVYASEWKQLHLDDPQSSDWLRAIDIFQKRFLGRFIEPVDLLIAQDETRPPIDRRFGFAVMAIDCLLIETLAAFREGLTTTRDCSKRVFLDFLHTRPLFGDHFRGKLAEDFYDDFRNGVLHQAETKRNSKIWSVGELVQQRDNGLIVNRTKLHDLIKDEISSYCQELLNADNAPLRANFRNKMDFICRSSTEL